jgi:putative ABC transport system permease protein
MGRLLLVSRLVVGDIRRRPVQSALLLVVIVTTTTTLTLGLTLRHVAQSPFAHTKAATRGPDLVVEVQPKPGSHVAPTRAFAPVLHAAGVAASGGPFPLAFVRLTAPGVDVPVDAEGRTSTPSAVNRPLITAGGWVRPGGAVIEQGLADTLDLRVGDRIELHGQRFRVVGIALQTEQSFYPECTPGLVWVTPADSERLATPANPLGYEVDLRLTHPDESGAFGNSAAVNAVGNEPAFEGVTIQTWQGTREDDYRVIGIDQKALLVGSWLLGLLAIASIAVVVGGRMAEQTRRVGLLKAVGATPRLVALILLSENLTLALAGAAIGVLAGWLIAPSFADPGSGVLGTPPAPALTAITIFEVALAAVAVAAAATILPAARGARASTIRALSDPARPPRRRPRMIALSTRLPVPLLLGTRLVARRPRRTVLSAVSLATAVTMVVAALTLRYQLDVKEQTHNAAGLMQGSAIGGRVTHLVLILGAVLVVLAAMSAILTTWATVIDAEPSTALARALGATPRQVTSGLTAAQLLPALLAACLGIPAGLAIYQLAGGNVATANPPLLMLLAVIPCTLAAVTVVTSIPARLGANRSVADVLRSE